MTQTLSDRDRPGSTSFARLFRDHPSSRQLGKRLGVSHTTIANKLRQHGLGKE